MRPEPPTLPNFHPIPGVEAEESSYMEWLLAGGEPLTAIDRAWADTTKDELR